MYVGGLLGLALLIGLFVHADLGAMLRTWEVAGWRLLWLVPYRAGYFLLYAIGWRALLRESDPESRASFGYVYWVTTVRDAIDRLLPVASVGGGVAAVRLMRWRTLPTTPVVASVIVEILLTLFVVYIFTAIGLVLLLHGHTVGVPLDEIALAFIASLLFPIVLIVVLRRGAIFQRLHGLLRPIVGKRLLAEGAESLDAELQAALRRTRTLAVAGSTQLLAFISASFEVWFALRLFGHPVGAETAVILESLTQAVRYVAFIVPAGVGIQEVAFVAFGHLLGVSTDMALSVSMAKRLREILCGTPSLASWQWIEGRRVRAIARAVR